MLLNSIHPKNFLSFGEDQPPIELSPLSILIGRNGSGKSNLVDLLGLLQSAQRGPSTPALDWLNQVGGTVSSARLEVVVANPASPKNLRYWLEFAATGEHLELTDERIENEHPDPGHDKPYFYFAYQNGWPVINVKSVRRQLKREDINPKLSILCQRKDSDSYPEITKLGESFGAMRLYRDWTFGRHALMRQPQSADLSGDCLAENGENLGLVLSRMLEDPNLKQNFLDALAEIHPAIEDIDIKNLLGAMHIQVREGGLTLPISRLSDGTLRLLSLLAILCHPNPPPLIAIEEPELGLQPDIMPCLARLLRHASTRTQLLVTTHSDLLAQEFLDTPENVIALEKVDGRTVAKRLGSADLENWLDQYTLGPEDAYQD